MMWQPIETAPKDGTQVLIVDINSAYPAADIAHWGSIGLGQQAWRTGEPQCWRSNPEECYELLGFYRSPTHWMPLPQPPEAE